MKNSIIAVLSIAACTPSPQVEELVAIPCQGIADDQIVDDLYFSNDPTRFFGSWTLVPCPRCCDVISTADSDCDKKQHGDMQYVYDFDENYQFTTRIWSAHSPGLWTPQNKTFSWSILPAQLDGAPIHYLSTSDTESHVCVKGYIKANSATMVLLHPAEVGDSCLAYFDSLRWMKVTCGT